MQQRSTTLAADGDAGLAPPRGHAQDAVDDARPALSTSPLGVGDTR